MSGVKMETRDKTREESWTLLNSCTKNVNLVKHALAVEAAMRHYALKFEKDVELWGTVGLLHDFDYEKYPSLEEHPYEGQKILESEGYSETVRRAIMAHAPHTKTTRDSLLKKAIYAVDELTGLIVAVALVRPTRKIGEVDVKAIKKKMKQKAFAAAVNREDIEVGAEELGLSLDEHIEHVLTAMKEVSGELGL